jgi:hypothetical protein
VNYTNTWTGVVDNQWNNSGNWSCGVLPNQSTDVVINAGSVLISSVDAFANTLTINGTSTVTVNSGTAISVTGAVNVASGATMTLQNNANLIQVTNVANTGAIVVNRQSSALMRQDYTLWSSPVMSQNLLAFSPQTLPNRFYVYNSATNVYNSVVPSTNSFQLGKGYLIRMPDNHPTTPTIWNGVFRGVPNNGTINLSLYNGGAGLGYNAIGNPYPSPIDLTSFVNGNNGNITGTLYFWRKTNSTTSEPGYCTWTTAGFVSNGESQVVNPNGVLRTGQGFIVEMSGNSNSLSFTNLMRINDTANQFFRNSNLSENRLLSGDKIWLNIVNETGADNQMLLGYFSSATLGMDYAIDGKAIEDASVSLTMDVSGVNCLIQGRPVFDISDIVPLRFKTPYSGLHTISIDHLEGVFSGNQEVYLKDNLLNVTRPIKASSYSFISDAGTFTNRFEIVYQNGLLSVNQADFNASLVVYKDKDGGLNITSNGFLVNQVEVYDISGRVLIKKSDVNSSSTTISGLNYTNQVLLVKVISADGKEAMKKIAF